MSGNGDIAIRVYQWCNSSTPFLKKEDQGQNLADPFEMPLPARGQVPGINAPYAPEKIGYSPGHLSFFDNYLLFFARFVWR